MLLASMLIPWWLNIDKKKLFVSFQWRRCLDGSSRLNCKAWHGLTMYTWWNMITSSNGNIFRVTGHLCGEFTSHRWIPHTKAGDAEFWCFRCLCLNKRLSKQSWGWWFERTLRPLWVTVMNYFLPIVPYDRGKVCKICWNYFKRK